MSVSKILAMTSHTNSEQTHTHTHRILHTKSWKETATQTEVREFKALLIDLFNNMCHCFNLLCCIYKICSPGFLLNVS